MNKICIWLALILISVLNCKAQPREDRVNAFKELSESGKIENPVGWSLDQTVGKWCGYYGVLINDFKNNSKKPIQTSIYQRSQLTNISTMQFKKYEAYNTVYYALYIVNYNGYYDYPAISRGWHYYKDCWVYLFTEEEYLKLLDLKEGFNTIHTFTFFSTNIDHKYGTNSGTLYINNSLDKIFYDMNNDEEYSRNRRTNPRFGENWYVKVEDDNTIRFILPTSKDLWEDAQRKNKEKENDKYYLPIRKHSCVDFSDEYFEVTKAQFDKLIIR